MDKPKHVLLLFLFVVMTALVFSQPMMHRTYPQYIAYTGFTVQITETPLPTPDGGYLLISKIFQYGFEQPGGIIDKYVIKTDANFVPQWKKKYPAACVLPTGGFILYGTNFIEKVTASGTQVWIKAVGPGIGLNDAVSYGANVRFVGSIATYSYVPATTSAVWIWDGFTLLTDSNGVYASHQLFYSSITNTFAPLTYTYRGSSNFGKIERDASGDFYVYSDDRFTYGGSGQMAIAKFNSSFGFLWARYGNGINNRFSITDIDITTAGRIFASASTSGNSTNNYQPFATMLKLDVTGNIVQQKYFPSKPLVGRLCRKTNGNYIIGTNTIDSVFMYETDTLMNVQWHKWRGMGHGISGSVITGTTMYTPIIKGVDLVVLSSDLSGSSCSSYTIPYTLPTTSLTLSNCTLTPVTSVCTVVATSGNSIYTQNYVDSCICPVFIPNLQTNLCIGITNTVTIQGTGNLSWYSTATGNSFIQSGSQYVFGSATPTVVTVFAQDSACTQFPNRTPVSVTVHAVPTITFSPNNPTICIGQQVFVSAGGALTYTWLGTFTTPSSNIQNLNPTTATVYTVMGSVAQNCNNTQTVGVFPIPTPTLSIAGNTNVCVGSTAVFTASGAPVIIWPNAFQSTTNAITPTAPGTSVIPIVGLTGNCQSSKTFTINRVAYPSLTLTPASTSICTGQNYTLSAAGASNYTWSTGQTTSTIYPVALSNTVITVSSNSLGCVTTRSANITALPSPTVSAVASQTQFCEGPSVSFTANGANSYTWQNTINSNTYATIPPVGNNWITVVGSIGNCTSAAVVQVVVNSVPSLSIISSPSIACAGKQNTLIVTGANNYTWSNGAQGNQALLIPTGNTSISVIGWNANCGDTLNYYLTVYPIPLISANPNTTAVCPGSSVTLIASGAPTLNWSAGIQNNVPFVPTTTGIYTVTGIDPNTCTGTATAQVTVLALPNLNVSGPTNKICTGTKTSWTASGAANYTWSTGANTNSVSIYPNANTVYTLTGLGSNGCLNTYTFTQLMDACTGLENIRGFESSILVFPNPSNGIVNVQSEQFQNNDEILVYDQLGKLVFVKAVSGNNVQIDLSESGKGLYLLVVRRDGQILANQKMLVD